MQWLPHISPHSPPVPPILPVTPHFYLVSPISPRLGTGLGDRGYGDAGCVVSAAMDEDAPIAVFLLAAPFTASRVLNGVVFPSQ